MLGRKIKAAGRCLILLCFVTIHLNLKNVHAVTEFFYEMSANLQQFSGKYLFLFFFPIAAASTVTLKYNESYFKEP